MTRPSIRSSSCSAGVRKHHGEPAFGLGQKDDFVRKAESRLKLLGYDPGAVDGVFDRETQTAVAAFKKDEGGLGTRGVIGKFTARELLAEAKKLDHAPRHTRHTEKLTQHRRLDAATRTAAGKVHADGTVGIGEGNTGRSVKNVQHHLRSAGFDPSRTDGTWDERTTGAMRAFQRKSGLPVTGRLDAKTWSRLNDAELLAKSGTSPAQSLGEQSHAVKKTEQLLRKLGHKKVRADGLFDRATWKAVRKFEKKHHLRVDGKVSTKDLKKMQGALRANQGRRVTGYVNGSPRSIRVSSVGNGEFLRTDAAASYKKMLDAARRAGVSLYSISGFRSMSEQRYLYNLWKSGQGNLAAPPGYSNHQGGVSMDIGGVGNYGTRAYNWLRNNAGRFGFVNDVAGEYWHWTYRR